MWLLLALACTTPSSPPPAVQPAVAPPPAPADGPAYLATAAGLVRVTDRFTPLPGVTSATALATGPDGTVWALAGGALARVVGPATQVVQPPVGATGFDRLAVDEDGSVWLSGLGVFGRFAGTFEPRPLPADVLHPSALHVHRGVPTLLDGTRVHTHAGSWRALDIADHQPNAALLGGYVPLPDGARVGWLGSGEGVLHLQGHRVLDDPAVARFSPDGRTLGATAFGQLWTLHDDTIRLYTDPVRIVTGTTHGYEAQAIDALAHDTRDRLWLATDRGLVLVTPGAPTRTWPPASDPSLRSPITAVLVVDGGPPTPPPVGRSTTARVLAQVHTPEGPLPLAPVALCDNATLRFRRHPCEEARTQARAETDDQGRVVFQDVPPGDHVLVARLPTGWVARRGVACCVDLQTEDLGILQVRPAPRGTPAP